MFERLDPAASKVLEAAFSEAAALGDAAICTEHLLLALATTDAVTARLLAEADTDGADIRQVFATTRGRRPNRHRDHATLLATLGIDVTEVRRRAEETFGTDAIARAARQVRPRRPRRPLWSWISAASPSRVGAVTTPWPARPSASSRGSNDYSSEPQAPHDRSPPRPAICSWRSSRATSQPVRSSPPSESTSPPSARRSASRSTNTALRGSGRAR